tara:strand:- start:239 stop:856 length:618 start_codon:yes stop_codon:yes gene_type:complete
MKPSAYRGAAAVKDYLIEIRVKNGPMAHAMRAAGLETAAKLARAIGVDPGQVGDFLNLKHPPITKYGRWAAGVLKISEALRVLPEDLFPPQHLINPLKKNRGEIELSLEDMTNAGLLKGEQSPDARIEQREDRAVLLWAIAKLTPPERSIVDIRFGITREPMTLDAVGKEIGTSRSRVGQLERKALRRLKASMKRRRADLKSRDL